GFGVRGRTLSAPGPGQPGRVESDYQRRGALQYLCAWDVRRGIPWGRCEPKTGIAASTRLVDQVMTMEHYRSAPRVFWIVDNGSSHRGKKAARRLRGGFLRDHAAQGADAGRRDPPGRACCPHPRLRGPVSPAAPAGSLEVHATGVRPAPARARAVRPATRRMTPYELAARTTKEKLPGLAARSGQPRSKASLRLSARLPAVRGRPYTQRDASTGGS